MEAMQMAITALEAIDQQRSKIDEPLSWWATAGRHGFTALATSHEARMRKSKEAHQITPRLLQ